jgi:3-hydroxyacyl-[acyl-carrier-protein] dehydratase
MNPGRIGPVDVVEIIRHMPHRYPFNMVDRVIEGEPGKWIRAVKNVTTSEPFFARLPANRRTMPQVLLIEALAQCTGVLCHFSGLSKPHGQTLTFFAALDQCRFTGSAAPGDQIVFECHLKRAMRGIVKFSGTGEVGDQPIISMALTAALRDRA